MHVVFRESHGLDETDTPQDLGQTPADLVVLSFSDSDLGAFAAGWHRGKDRLPSLRLANLVALKHPLSVDVYAAQTLEGAKGVLVRLIGGESYWSYGLATLQDLARRKGIALAVLPADGREDPRLDELSTLPVSTLRRLQHLCDTGGAVAAQAALAQLSLAAGLYAGPVTGLKSVPQYGYYDPQNGVVADLPAQGKPLVLVSFYRSYLTAADTAPVDALIAELRERGYAAYGVFAASLKAPEAGDWLRGALPDLAPAAIINATAFSAQGSDGSASPLSATGCPVFQVALSTARRRDWAEADRGLSPADLAMHVVLPEVDGRIFAGLVSFKAPSKKDPDLQYSRFAHRADMDRIKAAVDRIEGWLHLSRLPNHDKRLALVLSTYPGRDHNLAHAVGLDALASCDEILRELWDQGYAVEPLENTGLRLMEEVQSVSLADYHAALSALPQVLQQTLTEAWGQPEEDPDCHEGAFHFKALRAGNALIALQPERGEVKTRVDDYHDLDRTPRHAYVAFYMWLRAQADALVHIGAHGTLEWLPGKSVALSEACWPEVLTGPLPVAYPFIVNDPGEAAQAKRRIGAVTIGHLPPPLAQTNLPDGMARLESLLDEYSTADGLDPARRDRLIDDIRAEAQGTGVEADLGLAPDSCAAEAITRIDAFVCDIKESQYGEGLHIFGTGQCGADERAGLIAALNGQMVAPGPSGSPFRGRADVIPTGRNLFTTDPRAVPSRAAQAQGVKLAEELLRRHLQDHGDWPKGLVIDLWGSATMRTAGEEFAMALHLAGLAPKWDENSERVSGFEVLPLSMLNRPRIDVTLRVSGLFRDVFPGLAQMFEAAAGALAAREESAADNPYLTETPRVFGPKPGQYGLSMNPHLDDYTDEARQAAGEAWLNASSHAIDAMGDIRDARDALEARLQGADSFVHLQDLPETDLLVASDYAAHEAGFAAAMARLGQSAPALYHMDATRPDKPQARSLGEEIARVTRARAANRDWATSMMNHGFRGAAEIAATLDHMAAFAHLAQVVQPHLFDLYFEATLGRDDLVEFMSRENPEALQAMRDRFQALMEAGLWSTRRNSIVAELGVVV
ncbi:cobaltochelatase subunit CobN [Phaeobacter gallaeciensis]|uniref:Aerobic cobaltochelatase subunit CobN n=1 Tax=Phaeobacter gallaeciensis TaxID=60890 RepID=A0AAC9ZAQ7_9RHOB|nr:cobaltochelatase subunit CobN [Phaeobacter gallaeciensis]AHD10410.1 cobaltochelatase CobN subunit [Phaeobacter gallaeciensis DSM 26640]ATE93673.1 aerobic cobaltochelatase subunit CobN [Phaeobacter gallaeciensis]ATE96506.1 aerobic cobaltochelatase subunit CobN [Phaeobacter gallaeciensis]ATF02337.1 aerobic cobaltochelatase subunit CobN [Phaeobacter gallaeciensis]ATF06717.1 aerobic cobaltochelatase subunit CobN [Phaeobacter gallaeciensis]